MNIHTVSPPSSLTVFSIADTHVRTSKSQIITNDIKINCFWVLNPDQKGIARILVLDAIQAKPPVQYKDNYACRELLISELGTRSLEI